MDLETTQAVEELGSRIDRLQADMKGGFAGLRAEMGAGFADVRGELAGMHGELAGVRGELAGVRGEMRREVINVQAEIADLREDLRAGLESNWTRTQSLFESLRGDVQMLAGYIADLASRKPRS
jgi:hypothetical protein